MEFRIKTEKNPSARVTAEKLGQKIWIHVEGRTLVVDAQPGRAKTKRSAAGSASTEITAPMPGKITKILFSAQAPVQRGEAVVMMEAMKMEYTLKAEVDGSIAEISCREGQQVSLGQILVKLKKQEDV